MNDLISSNAGSMVFGLILIAGSVFVILKSKKKGDVVSGILLFIIGMALAI